MVRTLLVACLGWSVTAWSVGQDLAQLDPKHYRVEFADDQVRVWRVTLGPYEKGAMHSQPDGVLVFLTADLQGKMPGAEAQWEPAGPYELENLANTSFEAVLVELLKPPSSQPSPLTLSYATGPFYYPISRPAVTRLIDSERVSVSRHRFPGAARGDNLHAHATDTVIVYLSGGEMSGTTGHGPGRARRGQVDVLRANTLHQFANLGFDPIEFVVIHPK